VGFRPTFLFAMRVLLAILATTSAAATAQLEPEAAIAVALEGDDQCAAGDEQCALNALQLRGEKKAQWAACASYGCGSAYAHWKGCQCNSQCVGHGNCCADYGTLCVAHPAPAPMPLPVPPPAIYVPPSPPYVAPMPTPLAPTPTPPGYIPVDGRPVWTPPAPAPPATEGAGSWYCQSDLILGPVSQGGAKGMALDDTTFKGCSEKIPEYFPNTAQKIGSLRLFKAWDPEWPDADREGAWANIVAYVKKNNAKVLLGTEITCNKELDIQSWEWAKGLLKMLGPSYVMGLAIGNELELLSKMGSRRAIAPVTPECVTELWSGGYVQTRFDETVKEFDQMGFSNVPITSVLGGYSLAGSPFVNKYDAKINDWLNHLTKTYRTRYVFTFNFYPYFDTNMHLDPGSNSCAGALRGALNWGSRGFMPGIIRAAQGRVAQMAPGARMWLGETGWAAPLAPSLESQMKNCAAWSSYDTLKTFYDQFLQWSLTGVEHVFYFTTRDSEVFSVPEHFGLVATCPDTDCKLTKRTAGLLQGEVEAKVNMTAFEVTDAMVEAYSHQAVAAVMDN